MTEFLDDKIVKLYEGYVDPKSFIKGVNKLLDEWSGGSMNLTQLKRANNLINLAMDRIEKDHGVRIMKKDAYYKSIMQVNFG